MGLVVLFYYTLIILLVSIMTSAMFVIILVTHRKYLGFACIGFLFHFFDVALILLDDFTVNPQAPCPNRCISLIGSRSRSLRAVGCSRLSGSWYATRSTSNAAHCKSRLPSCSSSCLAITHLCHQATRTSSCFTGMRTALSALIMVYIAVRYMGRSDALARTHVAPSHWVCWRARAGSRRAYRKRPLPVLSTPCWSNRAQYRFFPNATSRKTPLCYGWRHLLALPAISCFRFIFVKPPPKLRGRVGSIH